MPDELAPADAVLARELGETRILLDGARAALRQAQREAAAARTAVQTWIDAPADHAAEQVLAQLAADLFRLPATHDLLREDRRLPDANAELAELRGRNRDLARELNTTIEERDDARDLLDGARLAFRAEQTARLKAEAELAELRVQVAAQRGGRADIDELIDRYGAVRVKLSKTERELDELLDAARRTLDGRLHAAVIRQSDLDNLDRLDVIVARLVPTRGKAAGCAGSPKDPQTRQTREEGTVSG